MPLKLLSLLKGKDVLVGVIDVATDKVETPEEVAQVIGEVMKYVPKERIVACTNCGMAPMRRDIAEAKLDGARQGRGAGAAEFASANSAQPRPAAPALRSRITSINSATLRR